MAADEQKAKDRTMDVGELSEQELGAAAGGRIEFDSDGYFLPPDPEISACWRWVASRRYELNGNKCCWCCGHFENSHCDVLNIGAGGR